MTAVHSYNMPIENVETNSSRLRKASCNRSGNPYHSIDCYNFISVVFYFRMLILLLIGFPHTFLVFMHESCKAKLRRHKLASTRRLRLCNHSLLPLRATILMFIDYFSLCVGRGVCVAKTNRLAYCSDTRTRNFSRSF